MIATLHTPALAIHNDSDNVMPRHLAENHGSGVAWSAVIAGAVAAISVGLMLITLGAGFGLAMASPWSERSVSATALTAGTAGWLVALYWITSGIGGYITGRLRTKWDGLHTHEVFFRDTANGFITWAVATLFGAVVVSGLAVATVSGVGGMAQGVASSAIGAASAAIAGNPESYRLDTLFRSDQGTATDTDVKAQSGRILLNAVSTGAMPDPDRAYLVQVIAASTGITPAAASKRIDMMSAELADAKVKTKQAVDAARKASATAAIFTGLAMLIGAFAACVAAAIGGQQRNTF